jgi:hypothetical protein
MKNSTRPSHDVAEMNSVVVLDKIGRTYVDPSSSHSQRMTARRATYTDTSDTVPVLAEVKNYLKSAWWTGWLCLCQPVRIIRVSLRRDRERDPSA